MQGILTALEAMASHLREDQLIGGQDSCGVVRAEGRLAINLFLAESIYLDNFVTHSFWVRLKGELGSNARSLFVFNIIDYLC